MLVTLKVELFGGFDLTDDYYPRHRMKILCESEDMLECDRARKNYYKKHSRPAWVIVVIIPKELIMNPVSLKTIFESL
jgi:hypothetical protein